MVPQIPARYEYSGWRVNWGSLTSRKTGYRAAQFLQVVVDGVRCALKGEVVGLGGRRGSAAVPDDADGVAAGLQGAGEGGGAAGVVGREDLGEMGKGDGEARQGGALRFDVERVEVCGEVWMAASGRPHDAFLSGVGDPAGPYDEGQARGSTTACLCRGWIPAVPLLSMD